MSPRAAPAAPSGVTGSTPAAPPRPSAGPPAAPPRPPLIRPRDRAIGGVASGIARHLGAPTWEVRALFVALTAMGGAGVLLYLWCWAFAPAEPAADGRAPSRRVPVAWLLTAASVVALAAGVLLGPDGGSRWASLVPAVVLASALAAGAGLWAAFVDRADPDRGPRHARTVRIVALGVLAATFLVVLRAADGLGAVGVLAALVPIAATAAMLSTAVIERLRELSGERIARIREEQRAEMAAHLHDSVLQTLALIQNRGGASSEVARLARAQERELRAWLYDGDQPADSDLPTDLRDYAGALELDYPVRIDVVVAGSPAERASGEVAAAAREAMLNAARHAGGEVSVYIEGTDGRVDVYIRDRGAGFDLDAVPDDRLGIRQSVLGRMRRVGGTATVRSDADGTEVHLHYGHDARPHDGRAGTRGGDHD